MGQSVHVEENQVPISSKVYRLSPQNGDSLDGGVNQHLMATVPLQTDRSHEHTRAGKARGRSSVGSCHLPPRVLPSSPERDLAPAPAPSSAPHGYSPEPPACCEACACTAGSRFSCGFTPVSYFQQRSSYLSRWLFWRKCAVGCVHRMGKNSGGFMKTQVLEECHPFVLRLHWVSAGPCVFCNHPRCF